jgi:hypothetical protein
MESDADRRQRMLDSMIEGQRTAERAKAEASRKAALERAAYPIWKRDEERKKQKEQRVAALRAEVATKVVDDCTFTPNVNKRSTALVAASRAGGSLAVRSLAANLPARAWRAVAGWRWQC